MAFLKGTHFAFEEKVEQQENKPEKTTVVIPFVVTVENKIYHGFVPGIVMNDVVCETKEQCIEKLKPIVKQYVLSKKQSLDFPFFPTNEEIKQDFKNVVLIKRVSVKI